MEETCAASSRALGSSLWEVAAMRRHFAAAPAAAAAALLASAPPAPIRLQEDEEVTTNLRGDPSPAGNSS